MVSWPICLGVWDLWPICSPSFFNYFRQLRVCWCGAPSLRRGRVCSFQLLLGIASAVFLGSESHWTHEHYLPVFYIYIYIWGGERGRGEMIPACKNERGRSGTNYVPTAGAICGVETDSKALNIWKPTKDLSPHTDLFELITSLLIRGIQMGEVTRVGWLIVLVKQDIWADSLYLMYQLLLSISKILASSKFILWPSS
jgi:hypothetical protein